MASRRSGARVAYVTARLSDPYGGEALCTPVVPCSIVVGGDPAKPRTLPRRLGFDRRDGPTTTLTGRLTRTRVDARRRHATSGVAGVPIELLSTDESNFDVRSDPSKATPTGLRAVTDANGRFAIALPSPGYPADYIARTADSGAPATAYVPVR